jgi:tight adherence protein B
MAGQPLKVNEYLGLRIAAAATFAVGGAILLSRFDVPTWVVLLASIVLVIPGWALPRAYLSRRRERRLQQFEDQLPGALTAIAKSLRAGTGLLQALAYAGESTEDPLGQELRSTLRDLQLGADPDLVFTELSERVGSSDMDIAVTAIIIQRSIGGNLSEILSNVTNTIRERAKLKGEIRVLTSRQRLTGNLVALLPVAVGAGFVLLNPKMGDLLLHETAGQIGLAIGIAFEIVGIWMIRRLAVIEV